MTELDLEKQLVLYPLSYHVCYLHSVLHHPLIFSISCSFLTFYTVLKCTFVYIYITVHIPCMREDIHIFSFSYCMTTLNIVHLKTTNVPTF